MDRSVLVESGKLLISTLDASGFIARAALWVQDEQTESWKLWIVPPSGADDQREFYRVVSQVIRSNQPKFVGLDAADVKMVPDNNPTVRALSGPFRIEGLSDIHISHSMFNGFYLAQAIVLRLAL